MANSNPYKARAAKRQKKIQRAGGIDDLRDKVWEALEAASDIVSDITMEAALRLRAVHAVTQAATSYTKVLDATEFEARLQALEEEVGADKR